MEQHKFDMWPEIGFTDPGENFESKTLKRMFRKLDQEVSDLEFSVEELTKERQELKEKVDKLENERFQDMNRNMVHTLKSFLTETTTVNDPKSAIMLQKIYAMQSIKEVRKYIDQVFDQTKKEFKNENSND